MDRSAFLRELESYSASDATEERMRFRMYEFAAGNEACFSRKSLEGHITASCWVLDAARSSTLLTWHKRLNRWLQMGGHIEQEDPTLLAAAMRELTEESGLSGIRPLSSRIFDLDIHRIPERRKEPEHLHYDVRFLLEADPAEPLVVSPESRMVAWVPLSKVLEYNGDKSIARMVLKSRASGSGIT